jgi:hypothetical protein
VPVLFEERLDGLPCIDVAQLPRGRGTPDEGVWGAGLVVAPGPFRAQSPEVLAAALAFLPDEPFPLEQVYDIVLLVI